MVLGAQPVATSSSLATAPALWTIPIPAIGRSGIPESKPLQCFQIFDEVSLLPVAEAEIEQRIVMIHYCKQIGGTAIVEVRWVLPERPQWCRPVHLRGATRCIYGFRSHHALPGSAHGRR